MDRGLFWTLQKECQRQIIPVSDFVVVILDDDFIFLIVSVFDHTLCTYRTGAVSRISRSSKWRVYQRLFLFVCLFV